MLAGIESGGFANLELVASQWKTARDLPDDEPLAEINNRTVAFATLGDALSDFVIMLSTPAIHRQGGRVRVYKSNRRIWGRTPAQMRKALKLKPDQPLVVLATANEESEDSFIGALDSLTPRLYAMSHVDGELRRKQLTVDHPAAFADCYAPSFVANLVCGQTSTRDQKTLLEIARRDRPRFRREMFALVKASTRIPERRHQLATMIESGRISASDVSSLLSGYLTERNAARRRAQRRFLRYLLDTLRPAPARRESKQAA